MAVSCRLWEIMFFPSVCCAKWFPWAAATVAMVKNTFRGVNWLSLCSAFILGHVIAGWQLIRIGLYYRMCPISQHKYTWTLQFTLYDGPVCAMGIQWHDALDCNTVCVCCTKNRCSSFVLMIQQGEFHVHPIASHLTLSMQQMKWDFYLRNPGCLKLLLSLCNSIAKEGLRGWKMSRKWPPKKRRINQRGIWKFVALKPTSAGVFWCRVEQGCTG